MTLQMQKAALLNFDCGYEDGDAFYAALVDAIDAVGDDMAPEFLARLALILSNQIGSQDILLSAISEAKKDVSCG